MKRSMDVARLNELANHPEIRPWVLGGDGPLDLAPLVLNPAVVVLEAEHGAFLLVPLSETVYDLHTMFLREGRGKAFFPHLAEMMRYVFTRTLALEIVTKIQNMNRAAAFAATKGGFRERFHRGDLSFRAISIEQWALGSHECQEEGQRLPFESDPVEACILGAGALMMYAGQILKGVDFINQWDLFAGAPTTAMVGPSLVNIRGMTVEVRDGQLGVLGCQLPQHLPSRESGAP